jgi:hypothetical protein
MLRTRKRTKRRAQSLVEFTLVAPLLLLIIALTVDFARIVYTYSAISAAARAGARTLSLKDQEGTDCQVFQTVSTGRPPDAAGLCAGSGGPRAPANQVRDVAIEVQYGFKPWISIVADFVPVFVIKTVSVVQTEY